MCLELTCKKVPPGQQAHLMGLVLSEETPGGSLPLAAGDTLRTLPPGGAPSGSSSYSCKKNIFVVRELPRLWAVLRMSE